VREYANVEPPFAADILRSRNTSGFDRGCAYPATFDCLQSELAKNDALSARGVTFYTPSLAFRCLTLLGISAIVLVLVHTLVNPHLDANMALGRLASTKP